MPDVQRWSLAQQVCVDMGRLVFGAAFHMRVEGREHIPTDHGALLVCNHPTVLDPVLLTLFMTRPVTNLADESLWHHEPVAYMLDLFGCVPIAKGENAITVIREADRAVRRGELVAIFPEGGLSDHGRLRRFRPGAARIAVEAQCPVVPVAFCGSYEAWPQGSVIPKPRPVTIRFGRPVQLERYYQRPRTNGLLRHISDEMQDAVAAIYTPWDPRRRPAQRSSSTAARSHSR